MAIDYKYQVSYKDDLGYTTRAVTESEYQSLLSKGTQFTDIKSIGGGTVSPTPASTSTSVPTPVQTVSTPASSSTQPVDQNVIYQDILRRLQAGEEGARDLAITAIQTFNNPAYSSISNEKDANYFINSGQSSDIKAGTDESEPPVRDIADFNSLLNQSLKSDSLATSDMGTLISQMQKLISGGTEKPAVVSMADTYESYRTKYGVEDLETQLSGLDKEYKDLLAVRSARINAEKNKAVPMNVIAGRVSEVEQQEMERLTAIENSINTINSQLKVKYGIVDTLMSLTQTDYNNAVKAYDSNFSNNMSIMNAIKGISDDLKTEAEKEADNARSSLQIIYNAVSSGATSLDSLSDSQKLLVQKLELQAGLPSGFLETLQNKNPKAEIITTYNWVGSDNTQYVSILTKDESGQIKVNNYPLGTAKKTATTSKEDEEEADKQAVLADIKSITGTDGYVDTEKIVQIRSNIAINAPSLLTWFDNAFPPSAVLNPNDKTTAKYRLNNSWK